MAGARIADSLTEYSNVKKGFLTRQLTNWAVDSTLRPAIPAGFTIEIGGSVYQFAVEEAIDLGALTAGQILYIKITVDSADVVSAEFSTTFPAAFNVPLNGWYDGADRYLPFQLYYDGTNWIQKTDTEIVDQQYDLTIRSDAELELLQAGDTTQFPRVLITRGTFTSAVQIDLDAHGVEVIEGYGKASIISANYVIPTVTGFIKCGAELSVMRNFDVISTATQTVVTSLVFDGTNVINALVENVNIDSFDDKGDGFSSFDGGSSINQCFVTDTYRAFVDSNNISNSRGVSTGFTAFNNCDQVVNCIADTCFQSFFGCDYLTGCIAINDTSLAFKSCSHISNCIAENSTSHGFEDCYFITGCHAKDCAGNGYEDCQQISSCLGISNDVDGFNGCVDIAGCSAENNTGDGFDNCKQIAASRGISNTGYGFNLCDYITVCRTAANTAGTYDALPTNQALNDWS